MKLIIIDGLDASGKDTHANLIKKRLNFNGEEVKIRSHPEQDNFFGRKAKEALLKGGKTNKIKASVFYALDVLRSVKKYHNKDENDILIMVRYLMGTAYLPKPLTKISYSLLKKILPTSKYMFLLDVKPEEALRRLQKRKEQEMFENIRDLSKVRKKILSIIGKEWYIIDTNKPIKEAADEINNILNGES